MACPSGSNSSSHGSSLEQLIEEINFQRAKEMRQLLKDDSGFVMLHGTAYWTDLFVRHFLMEEDRTAQESDDLLFFIRKQHLKEAKKSVPKFETLLEVQRRDSKKLPIGDPEIDWEETIYANLIIHRFDYYVTLAVCTRTSPKELQVLSRHTERVWASPSRRLMSDKGTSEDITYPNICFMLDNFDEAFTEIVVRDGEMVSVELVARDRTAFLQSVIFLGSVRYDALRRVYDARTSLTTRMAQRMTFGLYSGSDAQRMEFVRVRGPLGKGHAELAVTKPAGCGSPTSSEPGGTLAEQAAAAAAAAAASALGNKHTQRRASDPSGNFNCLTKTNFRIKSPDGSKTFTCENNVPTLVEDSVSEAVDGHLPDGAGYVKCSSAEEATAARDDRGGEDAAAGEWTAVAAEETDGGSSRTPATDESDSRVRHMTPSPDAADAAATPGGAEAEATPAAAGTEDAASKLATDAVACHGLETHDAVVGRSPAAVGGVEPAAGSRPQRGTAAPGTAERPGVATTEPDCDGGGRAGEDAEGRAPASERSPETQRAAAAPPSAAAGTGTTQPAGLRRASCSDAPRSRAGQRPPVVTPGMLYRRAYGQTGAAAAARCTCARTPDGTVVHYRCHVQQAFLRQRELDDGVCNPIWTMRGLSQSLHFWRETKRMSSLPLNTYLTYVMLPWHTIISDLIAKENRQDPILSF